MNTEPPRGTTVAVAMSGGVDSSVSAAWLKERGYSVIGISLQLHDLSADIKNKFGTCCSLTDIGDARRVAEKIKIPFYVANMEDTFDGAVVDDFIHEYLSGRTPNPCVRCNEKVKFRKLMDWALDLGADFLATGHYAQIRNNPTTSEQELIKAEDADKDQSYFLFPMKQPDLKRTFFPVGGFRKALVRDLARRFELPNADKPDSQEICFIQARNYKEFIEKRVPAPLLVGGPIVDTQGKILGQHNGIHQFTIGQRKGIGINSREPLFVIEVSAANGTVVVGPEELLFKKNCTVKDLNWINPPGLDNPKCFTAKIRYKAKESPVEIFPLLDNRLEVRFNEAQRAITPGQAIVFYEGDRVAGGGWIDGVYS